MAAVPNLYAEISMDPSHLQPWYWWLKYAFLVTVFNGSIQKWTELSLQLISRWLAHQNYKFGKEYIFEVMMRHIKLFVEYYVQYYVGLTVPKNYTLLQTHSQGVRWLRTYPHQAKMVHVVDRKRHFYVPLLYHNMGHYKIAGVCVSVCLSLLLRSQFWIEFDQTQTFHGHLGPEN